MLWHFVSKIINLLLLVICDSRDITMKKLWTFLISNFVPLKLLWICYISLFYSFFYLFIHFVCCKYVKKILLFAQILNKIKNPKYYLQKYISIMPKRFALYSIYASFHRVLNNYRNCCIFLLFLFSINKTKIEKLVIPFIIQLV